MKKILALPRILITLIFLQVSTFTLYAQNNCLGFDGTNDYVDCGTINLSGTILTLECWIKAENFDNPGQGCINLIGTEDGSGNSAFLRLGDGNTNMNKVQFVIEIGGQKKLWASTALSTNTWYHIAGVYDGASGMKIYINGVQDASNSQTGSITSNSTFLIGAIMAYGGGRFFTGMIDEVRIWNTARTESQIRQNMYKELAGNEPGLVAYYKFNETSGTTLIDSKENNNGTLTNMAGSEWQTSAAILGPKNTLDFIRSSSQYIDLATPTELQNLGLNSYTIEAWIKSSYTGRQAIFGNWSYSYGATVLEIYSSGNLRSYINSTGYNSNVVVTDGKWHHVAAVRNKTTGKLIMYVDGKEIYSQNAYSSAFTAPADIRFGIGSNPDGEGYELYFNGNIDEVRVWNVARTPSEIRENMMKSLSGNESNLVAYYNFDNSSGNILQDFSGNGNDGTLTNMDNSDWVSSSAFNTWLNTSSTSWSTTSNWSRGSIPNTNDNVGVYKWSTGSTPSQVGSSQLANLFIGTNANTTVSSTLSTTSNAIINSNITFPTNASTNNIGGSLIIGSGNTLTFQSGSKITVNGNLINEGNISLLSPASLGTPATLICNGTLTNNGTMSIQRYITGGSTDAGDYTWHSISLPVESTTAGTYFSGDYMYSYNEANNAWENIVPTASDVEQGKGYIVKSVNGNKTYTFSGTLNSGTYNYNLTRSGSGYNFVGNPYPSFIDLEAISRTNLGATVYVWNPTSENWSTYQIGSGAGSLGRYIQPMQGFFIQANSGGGSLGFDNADRTHSSSGNFLKNGVENPLKLTLTATGNELADDLFIQLFPQENDGYEMYSMNPQVPHLFVQNNSEEFCIYNIHEEPGYSCIPIGFWCASSGTYNLSIAENDFSNYSLIIEDLLEGTHTPISTEQAFTFDYEAGSSKDRFCLHFLDFTGVETNSSLPYIVLGETNNIHIKTFGESAHIEVYDINGRLLSNTASNGNEMFIPVRETGLYIVKINTNEKTEIRKVVVN